MRVRVPLVGPVARGLLVAVVAGGLLVASVAPVSGGDVPGGPGVSPFAIAHVVGYGVLGLVVAYALADSPRSRWQTLAAVLVGTVCYGAVVELVQAPVPSRAFDTGDMLLNGLGAGVAVGCWVMLDRLVTFYEVDIRTRVWSGD